MFDVVKVKEVVKIGGNLADSYFGRNVTVRVKQDRSLVSNADEEVSDLIMNSLQKISPDIPVISEEGSNFHLSKDVFWLLDPIDCTNNFLKTLPEYTVNLALIVRGIPEYGFVYYPTKKLLYYTNEQKVVIVEQDHEKKLFSIDESSVNSGDLRMLTSSVNEDIKKFARNNNIDDVTLMHQVVRIGKVFDGSFDIYCKFGDNMEWDTAAWQALFGGMGGCIVDHKGDVMKYGKPDFLNPNFFACNKRSLEFCLKWL